MSEGEGKKATSFFSSLAGLITALAGFLGAVATLLTIYFSHVAPAGDKAKTAPAAQEAKAPALGSRLPAKVSAPGTSEERPRPEVPGLRR